MRAGGMNQRRRPDKGRRLEEDDSRASARRGGQDDAIGPNDRAIFFGVIRNRQVRCVDAGGGRINSPRRGPTGIGRSGGDLLRLSQ